MLYCCWCPSIIEIIVNESDVESGVIGESRIVVGSRVVVIDSGIDTGTVLMSDVT